MEKIGRYWFANFFVQTHFKHPTTSCGHKNASFFKTSFSLFLGLHALKKIRLTVPFQFFFNSKLEKCTYFGDMKTAAIQCPQRPKFLPTAGKKKTAQTCQNFCSHPSNVFAQRWQKFLHCTTKGFAIVQKILHFVTFQLEIQGQLCKRPDPNAKIFWKKQIFLKVHRHF